MPHSIDTYTSLSCAVIVLESIGKSVCQCPAELRRWLAVVFQIYYRNILAGKFYTRL